MWCCMLHYVFIMSFDIYVNSRGTVTQHLSCMYYICVYLCVSLLVALDCIGQVYQLDVTNQEHITTYSIDKSLEVSWNIACICVCAGSNVYCYPQFHFCNLQCTCICYASAICLHSSVWRYIHPCNLGGVGRIIKSQSKLCHCPLYILSKS